MIQRLARTTKTLNNTLKFAYLEEWEEHFIRPMVIAKPIQYRKMYKKTKQLRPFPKVRGSFYDALYMPGLDRQRLLEIQKQIINRGEVAISNQFVAMLFYHLSQNNLMLANTMTILEDWIPRHKGEYTSRQIFGCLYGSIIHNSKKHIHFFLEEMRASNLQFQLSEAVEIIQALNKNNHWTLEEKHKFWQQNFKQCYMDNMHRLIGGKVQITLKIVDAFKQFEYYDEEIWDRLLILLDNKTGWVRTVIIERLYPLTGTFDKAKMLFDKYYTKLSTNRNVIWRYNLAQLRLFSSQQMIAKSQQNIQMSPSFRSLIPKDKLQDLTKRYEKWLVIGNVKQEDEIIRDKSASFGYAIKDRFVQMTKDNVDFSKLTKKQFQELFGEYDQALMKDKEESIPEEVPGEVPGEVSEQVPEGEQPKA